MSIGFWRFGQILVGCIESETVKDVCRQEAINANTMQRVVNPVPHFVCIDNGNWERWFTVEYLYTKNGNPYYRIIH